MADPDETVAKMVQALKEKTGRSLAEWTKVAKSGGQAHGEMVAHLKKNGLTHGYANLVAHQVRGSDAVSRAGSGVDLVAAQYSGAKAGLRPIYDGIIDRVKRFGKDVDVSPKNAYVSLRRSKQFAMIQPSTATRIDVGLNLKGVAPKGRLEASGSFSGMCSHRVRVASAADADDALIGWLKEAYDKA